MLPLHDEQPHDEQTHDTALEEFRADLRAKSKYCFDPEPGSEACPIEIRFERTADENHLFCAHSLATADGPRRLLASARISNHEISNSASQVSTIKYEHSLDVNIFRPAAAAYALRVMISAYSTFFTPQIHPRSENHYINKKYQ